jgi:hypothetical protein
MEEERFILTVVPVQNLIQINESQMITPRATDLS